MSHGIYSWQKVIDIVVRELNSIRQDFVGLRAHELRVISRLLDMKTHVERQGVSLRRVVEGAKSIPSFTGILLVPNTVPVG